MAVVLKFLVNFLVLIILVYSTFGLYCGHSVYRACPDGSGCYHTLDLCDGEAFCDDNFDEDPNMCKEFSCDEHGENRMKCGDGKQCIHRAFGCDGKPECNDGSDEDPNFCKDFQCFEGYNTKCADGITCAKSQRFCPN